MKTRKYFEYSWAKHFWALRLIIRILLRPFRLEGHFLIRSLKGIFLIYNTFEISGQYNPKRFDGLKQCENMSVFEMDSIIKCQFGNLV